MDRGARPRLVLHNGVLNAQFSRRSWRRDLRVPRLLHLAVGVRSPLRQASRVRHHVGDLGGRLDLANGRGLLHARRDARVVHLPGVATSLDERSPGGLTHRGSLRALTASRHTVLAPTQDALFRPSFRVPSSQPGGRVTIWGPASDFCPREGARGSDAGLGSTASRYQAFVTPIQPGGSQDQTGPV